MFQWTRESVNILNIEKLHQGKQTWYSFSTPREQSERKSFCRFQEAIKKEYLPEMD